MEEKLTALKAAIVAGITTIASFLGWKGIMALVWVAVMILDYLSGTAAACKKGEWSSSVARSGLWHKAGMILAVTAAGIADIIITVIAGNIPEIGIEWPGLIFPLVMAWYILTELGSILENAVKLGANVPSWLVRILKNGTKAVDGHFGADDSEVQKLSK